MQEYNLPPQPEFLDERGCFIVKLYKYEKKNIPESVENRELILFVKRREQEKEICNYLGLSSVTYAIQTHIMPLVDKGIIKMSIPDVSKSPKQLFYMELTIWKIYRK